MFEPSLADVLVVRAMLEAVTLPELVGIILDHAEYWVRSSTRARLDTLVTARRIGPGEFDYQGSRFLLRSYPLGFTQGESSTDYATASVPARPIGRPCGGETFRKLLRNPPSHASPARKIVFRVRAHDQGWTTDPMPGPYIAAKTWFDAGIERFDAEHNCDECADMKRLPLCKLRPIEPDLNGDSYAFTPWRGPREIQRNKMADLAWANYETTWTRWDVVPPDSPEARALMEEGKGALHGDGGFVRDLHLGDVVTMWGRAMHHGWVNYVESVQMDVYWAI